MNQLLFITAQCCGDLEVNELAGLAQKARSNQRPVLESLLECDKLEEQRFLHHISRNFLMRWWEPQDWNWNRELGWLISQQTAVEYGIVPIQRKASTKKSSRDTLMLATYNPHAQQAILRAEHESGLEVELYLTTRSMVQWGQRQVYGEQLKTTAKRRVAAA